MKKIIMVQISLLVLVLGFSHLSWTSHGDEGPKPKQPSSEGEGGGATKKGKVVGLGEGPEEGLERERGEEKEKEAKSAAHAQSRADAIFEEFSKASGERGEKEAQARLEPLPLFERLLLNRDQRPLSVENIKKLIELFIALRPEAQLMVLDRMFQLFHEPGIRVNEQFVRILAGMAGRMEALERGSKEFDRLLGIFHDAAPIIGASDVEPNVRAELISILLGLMSSSVHNWSVPVNGAAGRGVPALAEMLLTFVAPLGSDIMRLSGDYGNAMRDSLLGFIESLAKIDQTQAVRLATHVLRAGGRGLPAELREMRDRLFSVIFSRNSYELLTNDDWRAIMDELRENALQSSRHSGPLIRNFLQFIIDVGFEPRQQPRPEPSRAGREAAAAEPADPLVIPLRDEVIYWCARLAEMNDPEAQTLYQKFLEKLDAMISQQEGGTSSWSGWLKSFFSERPAEAKALIEKLKRVREVFSDRMKIWNEMLEKARKEEAHGPNPFRILGVDPGAGPEAILKAYTNLAFLESSNLRELNEALFNLPPETRARLSQLVASNAFDKFLPNLRLSVAERSNFAWRILLLIGQIQEGRRGLTLAEAIAGTGLKEAETAQLLNVLRERPIREFFAQDLAHREALFNQLELLSISSIPKDKEVIANLKDFVDWAGNLLDSTYLPTGIRTPERYLKAFNALDAKLKPAESRVVRSVS